MLMGANSQRRFIPNLYSTCSFIARNASHLFPTIDATYSRSETNSNRNSTRKKTDDTLKSEHFSPFVTRFDTRSKDRITIFQSFANIFANTLENNSVRAIEVRESHWQVARRGYSIRCVSMARSKLTRETRERKEKEGCISF